MSPHLLQQQNVPTGPHPHVAHLHTEGVTSDAGPNNITPSLIQAQFATWTSADQLSNWTADSDIT